jgi:hypothetical protein
MSLQELLQDELDRAIGDGPDHRPLEATLRSGRRALRVRRTVTAAAMVAVVAGIGTTWSVVQDAAPRRAEVADGSYTPTPGPPVTLSDDYDFAPGDPAAALTPDGLALRPAARVVAHVENPMEVEAPAQSLGLVVRYDGTTQWLLLSQERDGTTPRNGLARRTEADDEPGVSFEEWLADAVADQRAEPRPDPGVLPADYVAGQVRLAPGVELVRRVEDPLPPTGAAGFDSVGLVLDVDGVETWVLLQTDDGGGFGVFDEASRDQTFDEWLTDAVAEQQRGGRR